ncbi:testicular acid phosphatase homolog [Phymastichus coffea]|uniref:testicular acid phosphatase homolog n=1 Tax=Phymastichus coffea TaxID=108790 RepID=UPI00273B5896|nr:testicular acid phosphatase homolog [Phymastichus coffea]
MNTLVWSFATLALSFDCGKAASYDNLKMELVQVLFRHGARTPLARSLDFYTGANRSIYEPWGIGVLTNVGKQQAHNLGLFLRSRYRHHLSIDYKAEELYAYSSVEDRTKTTMELVLAGLYPPTAGTIWNSSLLWSPVPFQCIPKQLDVILRGFQTPKFLRLLELVRNSTEYRRRHERFAEALSLLDEKTGVKATANFSTLTYIFDVLYANEYIDAALPDWYTPKIRETLLEVQRQEYDDYVRTQEMRAIGIGFLARTLLENMNLNETKNNPRKIYLYSGHESDLALFTRVHGIREFSYPHFGDALIFEKWRDPKDEVYVRLLAWRGNENLLTLKLGRHNNFCPIKDYLKIVTPFMLHDNGVDDILKEYSLTQLKSFLYEDTVVTG